MPESSAIEVLLEIRIYSNVPGRTGNWVIIKRRSFPAVPRQGDDIEIEDGWASEPVKRVSFRATGDIIVVDLRPWNTDNPEIIDEAERLVREYGWAQMGEPWANQGKAEETDGSR